MSLSSFSHDHTSQTGSTLVISMVILIIVMLIGVTTMVISNTQFKLAGNLQFEDSAMNNTETAVTTAENWLSTGTNYNNAGFTTYSSATAHLHPTGHLEGLTAPDNDPLSMTWDDDNSAEVAGNSNQRYLIQQMSTGNRLQGSSQAVGGHASSGCNHVNTYLITARGMSARGATKFVQSFYSVLSC